MTSVVCFDFVAALPQSAAMGGGGKEPPPWDGKSMNIHVSSTFGAQKSSSRRTAPAFGFGAATREVANKVFVSQEHTSLATAGMHSPGPAKYVKPPSIGGTRGCKHP